MAKPLTCLVAVTAVVTMSTVAVAQQPMVQTPQVEVQTAALDFVALGKLATQFSNDCRVSCTAFEARAALRNVRRALREKRPIKVLSVGASSTASYGASSPVANYPVRLETTLEGFLQGIDFQVIARSVPGEVAHGAADRLKLEVADVRPDLVVWQVGTSDAMARIGETEFAELLRSTIRWLKQYRVDVLLIDPQYIERLAGDAAYQRIVATIRDVARQERALLVHRYDTMADLAKQKNHLAMLASDRFHLTSLGYRCLAEYAARAIIAGVVEAESEQSPLKN